METETKRKGPYVLVHRPFFLHARYLGEYRIYDTRDTAIEWSMVYEDDTDRICACQEGETKLQTLGDELSSVFSFIDGEF
jgi:hypothetical protein